MNNKIEHELKNFTSSNSHKDVEFYKWAEDKTVNTIKENAMKLRNDFKYFSFSGNCNLFFMYLEMKQKIDNFMEDKRKEYIKKYGKYYNPLKLKKYLHEIELSEDMMRLKDGWNINSFYYREDII